MGVTRDKLDWNKYLHRRQFSNAMLLQALLVRTDVLLQITVSGGIIYNQSYFNGFVPPSFVIVLLEKYYIFLKKSI